jgi:hypothetical protein
MFAPRIFAVAMRGDVQHSNRASTLQDSFGSTAFMPGAHHCQTPDGRGTRASTRGQATRNRDPGK